MTCPNCAGWCATTEEQLATRLRNMGNGPEATPHPCPTCGDADWITSRDMIEEAKPRTIWQRLKAPPWLVVRAGNAFLASLFGGLAIMAENKWLILINGFLAGFAVASLFHDFMMRGLMSRMHRRLDEGQQALEHMQGLNSALLANKVQVMISRIDEDDEPSIAPKNLN